MTMGVYCIQLEKENYWCSYVGISINIEQRWKDHICRLDSHYHPNNYLQQAWKKYGGIDSFKFYILEEEQDYNKLLLLEKKYAYAFGYPDRDLCFNIGSPGGINPTIGRKHTEGTKQKMREAKKGKKHTKEHRQKVSEAQQGEKHSRAKLTELQARFILTVKTTRKNHMTSDFKQQELADYFEVTVQCIKHIMQQSNWKHIEPLPIEEYEIMKQELLSKKEV